MHAASRYYIVPILPAPIPYYTLLPKKKKKKKKKRKKYIAYFRGYVLVRKLEHTSGSFPTRK